MEGQSARWRKCKRIADGRSGLLPPRRGGAAAVATIGARCRWLGRLVVSPARVSKPRSNTGGMWRLGDPGGVAEKM